MARLSVIELQVVSIFVIFLPVLNDFLFNVHDSINLNLTDTNIFNQA